MSAKTTATVNIVDADLFVDVCVECNIETHVAKDSIKFGNINGIYHNCELKFSKETDSFYLEGDNEFVHSMIDKAMPLYNTRHLCNSLNESGKYRVIDESVELQHDGSYKFNAMELTVN